MSFFLYNLIKKIKYNNIGEIMKRLIFVLFIIICIPYYIVNKYIKEDRIKFIYVTNKVVKLKREKTGERNKITCYYRKLKKEVQNMNETKNKKTSERKELKKLLTETLKGLNNLQKQLKAATPGSAEYDDLSIAVEKQKALYCDVKRQYNDCNKNRNDLIKTVTGVCTTVLIAILTFCQERVGVVTSKLFGFLKKN